MHRSFAPHNLLLALVLALTAAPVTTAQAPRDPAARVAAIAPLLDDQTIVVARLDVQRVDSVALVKMLSEAVPPGDADLGQKLVQLEQAIKLVKTTLRAAGIGEVFAIVSLRDVPKDPVFLVAQIAAGGDAAQAADILKELTRFPAGEAFGNLAVVGSPDVLTRLKSLKPTARPDLVKAFALAGDTTAQIVLMPTDDTRRVLREMLPRLPEQVGGGSGQMLADGIVWAVLSADAPPKLSLNLTIQSKDEASATALRGVALNAIEMLRAEVARHEAKFKPGEREAVEAAIRLITPKLKGDQLVVSRVQDDKDVKSLLQAVVPALQAARTAAGRSESTNNLKQIALAMHNYHDTFGRFPPQAIRGKDGKALLSWRVAILPYIEQQALYNEFRLDEPWDSAHNKKLIERMPAVLAAPHLGEALRAKGMTSYVVPLSKQPPAVAAMVKEDPKKPIVNGKNEMVFDLPHGTTFARILDGTSNTIMVLEVHPKSAVAWTRPDDLVIDEKEPLKALLGQPSDGFSAAFCDGSVRFIKTSIDPKTWLNLLQMNDGNAIGEY